MFILIFGIVFNAIKIYKWNKDNKDNKGIMDRLDDENILSNIKTINGEYLVDFDKLKKINEDAVGWIIVKNTNISYPIVKTDNNEYYLHHNLYKEKNDAGWVFVDYRNKLDGNDHNIILYAHNRIDGTMFGTMKDMLKKEWYEQSDNQIITLITEQKETKYQIFSMYKSDVEDYYISTSFSNEKEYTNFLETLAKRSINNFNIDLSDTKSIITLSTCTPDNKRVVVHAKEI